MSKSKGNEIKGIVVQKGLVFYSVNLMIIRESIPDELSFFGIDSEME